MREAIGGTWIFQIVIFFILLFTGYMCMSINHSKAFNVKDIIVKEIERREGVDLKSPQNDPAIQNIVESLKNVSYRTTASCPEGYEGFDRNGSPNIRNASFCIKAVKTREDPTGTLPNMTYYRVMVFYQLDLPIFRSVFNFRITGDTKIISHSTNTNGGVKS